MGGIHIGPMCYQDREAIAQIVSMDHISDKTFLRVAQQKGKVKPLFGRQHRTVIILTDGEIILTPFSAKSIFARIQKDSM